MQKVTVTYATKISRYWVIISVQLSNHVQLLKPSHNVKEKLIRLHLYNWLLFYNATHLIFWNLMKHLLLLAYKTLLLVYLIMLVGLLANHCIYIFDVNRINQWYLFKNEASPHSIYFIGILFHENWWNMVALIMAGELQGLSIIRYHSKKV